MKIRPITVEDAGELQRIRDQVEVRLGFKLDLPDFVTGTNGLSRINPRFGSALVFTDDAEVPRMATILKKTSEAYLLIDKSDKVSHQEWFSRFLCMEKASHQHAVQNGIVDTFTFLPPELAETWSRVLEGTGWRKEPWPVWRKSHGK